MISAETIREPSDLKASSEGALQEWRHGWPLVLMSLVALSIANLMIYSLSVLMGPIQHDTGWTRAQITLGLLVQSITSIFVAPVAGRLMDRFGVQRVAVPGLVCYGLAIMAMSVFSFNYWGFIATWLIIMTSSAFINVTIWPAAIAKVFNTQRGLALGVALCGGGLGTAVIPIITSQLIVHFDWRHTYLVMGAAVLCLLPPLLLAFRATLSLKKDGPTAARSKGASIPLARLFRSRHFYALAYAAFMLTLTQVAISIHFVPMLTAKGISITEAAAISGLIGLSSIFGRLVMGLALDRSSGPWVGATSFALPMVTAILFLFGGPSPWMAGVAALSLGLASGAEADVIPYMTTRYFGVPVFGSVFSLFAVAMSLGVGVGPLLASLSVDVTGSYVLALSCVIPLSALALAGLATLGPWRLVIQQTGLEPSS